MRANEVVQFYGGEEAGAVVPHKQTNVANFQLQMSIVHSLNRSKVCHSSQALREA